MNLRGMGVYALLIGVLCVVFGLLEAALVFMECEIWIPRDLFGGLALIVIGAVYLSGVRELLEEKNEGISFLLVGSILIGVFGILHILMIGADWLMYLLGEVDEFPVVNALRPEILLFVAAFPVIVYFIRGVELQSSG